MNNNLQILGADLKLRDKKLYWDEWNIAHIARPAAKRERKIYIKEKEAE